MSDEQGQQAARKPLNQVKLAGNAGGDAEVYFPMNGGQITKFRMATSNGKIDKNGPNTKENQRPSTWHQIVVFKENEAAANVKKGDWIELEGKISVRDYDGKDGVKRYVTEIVAFRLDVNPPNPTAGTAKREAYASRDDRPLPGEAPDLFSGKGEDDVPF